MADLKTDYKDDILDTSQNTKRKYQMIDNGDGTVSFEDVTEYLQQGDSFGADDINDTNEEVNIINDKLTIQSYTPSTSNLNLAESIDNYIANASMSDGESRQVYITITLATPRSYIVNINKYNSMYVGIALRPGNELDRYIITKTTGSTYVTSLTPNSGVLKAVVPATGVTFKSALQQIFTVYNSLQEIQKLNCKLRYGNTFCDLYYMTSGDGSFSVTCCAEDSALINYTFNLATPFAYKLVGSNKTDLTNTTLNYNLVLYCFNTLQS